MYLPDTIQIDELPMPENMAAIDVKIIDIVGLFGKKPK